MSQKMDITDLNIQPKTEIKVTGEILPGASHFAITLAEDHENFGLHFNPRFKIGNDNKIIACNSKYDDVWGEEQKEANFPFEPGTLTEVWFTFDKNSFFVKLPDDSPIKFPNRLNLDIIKVVKIKGDFKLKSIRFD
ncbi:galectin-1-like [Monodelphis domestica]|uniref:galectin-1-like n=1 Tax=Monodelphis domestica TaxID=13616 RepID=UPI0024E1C425|nr:galectin-1-like [Monodelphis domestica]